MPANDRVSTQALQEAVTRDEQKLDSKNAAKKARKQARQANAKKKGR